MKDYCSLSNYSSANSSSNNLDTNSKQRPFSTSHQNSKTSYAADTSIINTYYVNNPDASRSIAADEKLNSAINK